ncbi:AMP-binding protein [Xanthobacter sp. KR7-225]|uniref:class I adenylate-forming enzyme family protein n=1 Tax=Xanthobacter sp. KR7-225 TaxID=3156613 RepID=UPI0032B46E5E
MPDQPSAPSADSEISFGARLRQQAARRGDAPAVTVVDARTGPGLLPAAASWRGLDELVDRAAHVLADRSVGPGMVVGIGLRNCLAHVVAVLAAWRLGATIITFDAAQPAARAADVLRRAGARFALAEDGRSVEGIAFVQRSAFEQACLAAAAAPVADLVPLPGKIVQSGGSTGVPKLMADDRPWQRAPGRAWGNVAPALGFCPDQVQLVAAAMSHNAALTWAQIGLFEGHHLVVLEQFEAERAVAAIETHRVEFLVAVPTMMVRMADLPGIERRDWSALRSFYHTGAPCAEWLKRRWIDILGPDRVFEMYGSGENVGQTIVGGRDWLAHPGTVGRPFETDARILDPDGRPVPAGAVGELFMRRQADDGTVRYLDPEAKMRTDADGFTSIGDMARMDGEGYVYLAGRRDDVINTGGIKVHPEKIEAVLLAHPAVRDVVVIGLPDREWGETVHAVAEPVDAGAPPDLAALRRHCAGQLTAAELPKGLTVRPALPRDGFGKVMRRAVRAALEADGAERTASPPPIPPALGA